MSHAPERKEKDCLNCGTVVQGKFCHICGQENIVPKESFGKLVIHFFYDITHFDGKFFETSRFLLFKPGFLSKEFVKGRRARYLNPVRMYVFTSALFFLVFFAWFKPSEPMVSDINKPMTREQRQAEIKDLRREIQDNPADSIYLKKQIVLMEDTSRPVSIQDIMAMEKPSVDFNFFYPILFDTQEAYDSAQATLPPRKRDGWVKRRVIAKGILFRQDIRSGRQTQLRSWGDEFLHSLPYLLFVSLPVFALILKLLFVRRKSFYYADHIIFSINHYILSFWLLLLFFAVEELYKMTDSGFLKFLRIIIILLWPVYLFLSMRRFYSQGWAKTLIKFLLLNILGLVMLIALFVVFAFIVIF